MGVSDNLKDAKVLPKRVSRPDYINAGAASADFSSQRSDTRPAGREPAGRCPLSLAAALPFAKPVEKQRRRQALARSHACLVVGQKAR
jgi:hypothetical protein